MRFVRERGELPDAVDPEVLHDAVASYPLSLAVLFGSYAAGTTHPLSDLDVAIKFEKAVTPDLKPTLLDRLTATILETTGIDAIDLVDLDEASPALGYRALADGVLVYGDRETAVALESTFLLRMLDFQPVKREWDAALSDRIEGGSFGRP